MMGSGEVRAQENAATNSVAAINEYLFILANLIPWIRRDESEELLLRLTLVQQLDGTLQLYIVRKLASLRCGVAERETRNAILQLAVEVPRGAFVQFLVDVDTLLLESLIELFPPGGRHGEVRRHLRFHLVRVVVQGRVN